MNDSLWCPQCKMQHPTTEVRCKCGFCFVPLRPEYYERPQPIYITWISMAFVYGLIFIGGGVVSSFAALRYLTEENGIGTQPGTGQAVMDFLSMRFLVGGIGAVVVVYGWVQGNKK